MIGALIRLHATQGTDVAGADRHRTGRRCVRVVEPVRHRTCGGGPSGWRAHQPGSGGPPLPLAAHGRLSPSTHLRKARGEVAGRADASCPRAWCRRRPRIGLEPQQATTGGANCPVAPPRWIRSRTTEAVSRSAIHDRAPGTPRGADRRSGPCRTTGAPAACTSTRAGDPRLLRSGRAAPGWAWRQPSPRGASCSSRCSPRRPCVGSRSPLGSPRWLVQPHQTRCHPRRRRLRSDRRPS